MPNVMVALLNIRPRWCPVLNAAKFGSCPLLQWRAVTLPRAERKTRRTQSEFCTHVAKFHYGATTAENVYIVYQLR